MTDRDAKNATSMDAAGDAFARRAGEEAVALPDRADAGLHFIGRIHTPWTVRGDCPKNGLQTDAACTVAVDPRYAPGLQNVEGASHLILLYWMDRAERGLLVQRPRHADGSRGTFSLRSPARPNPIALSVVELLGRDGATLTVRGLDCLDGTPLLDIKPYYATTDSRPDATVDRAGTARA
ncbi:tRNA (N6-threonylcarbamoyladenosine(37)-N6)-methyltransferase TrmO [Methylobacterium sp. HMF5984]|jgi:tRNA-Thr(GGU) m(6)t(6)A37 methyltransferase TsaA|uniref:tRNA (N6-threonylcarbamoyladenosine(37)-N6)-methyltransferase TrmO n=2 Tax=Methylobacterium TaxID=407 RepID=UPI00385335B8